jgi:glc operon protein GlcG
VSDHVREVRVLTLEAAKTMAAAAEAFAVARGWTVAIAVVDPSGGLILLHCLDDTQPASHRIAVEKARTAALMRRPSQSLDDAIAGGRPGFLSLGAVMLGGGLPVRVDGQVVGAIGVSGMTSAKDAEVADAGVQAIQG